MGPQPDLQVQVVWLPPASVGGRKKLVVFDSPVRKREKKRGGMPLFGKSVSVDCLMFLLDNTLKKKLYYDYRRHCDKRSALLV